MNLQNITDGLAKARAALAVANGLYSEVSGLIDMADALLPAKGQGAAKLDLVKNAISKSLDGAGLALDLVQQAWPIIDGMITAVVAFKKTTPAPAPVAAQ